VKVDLTRRLAKYIASPEVSVIVREIHSRKVSVLGEVRNPAATTSGAGRPSSTASPSRADSMTLLANRRS
jgi:protein involved in polysaccharide export with SLBB domain